MHHGIHRDILGGRPVQSIHQLSYRLENLILKGSIDLSLFFEHFEEVAKDRKVTSHPSWPALRGLVLEGSIARRSGAEKGQTKDQFLRCVGLATRNMPKIHHVLIESELQPGSDSVSDTMLFCLGDTPFRLEQKSPEKLYLSVFNHTPSPAAVNVWKEALFHTKRKQLAVEFIPDGNLLWQVFREHEEK